MLKLKDLFHNGMFLCYSSILVLLFSFWLVMLIVIFVL